MEEEVQCKENEINGESGDVRGETVDSWKERIPELLQGYSSENIWNLDETACFGRLYPIMVFAREDHSAKVGKKAKQQVTIALIANADGEKEGAVVIWKSENPRCFKGIDRSNLAVQYFSQPKR